MKSSLLKLYKFFKLEVEHNYDNRAVIGGLAKILATWEAEARLENVPDGLIQTVASCLHDYSRLEPAGRSEALENLWQQIQREAGETLPPLPAPSPSKSERAEPEPKEGMPTPKPTGPRRPRPPLVEEAPRERQSLPERQALSAPIPEAASVALNASVTVLSGVGPKHGQTLGRLGLKTLGDMLYYFPRRYDDYSKLKPINRLWYGEEVTVIGVVQSVNARIIRGGRARFSEAVVSDGSGALRLTLWNPYVAKRMRAGMEVVLSGKVDQYLGRLVMVNPEVEPLEQENLHTNRIVPVYPLTSNITQRWLRKQMYQVVTYWAPRVRDMLPETTRQSAGLVDLSTALLQAHFPESMEKLQVARHRLAFDEIFLLQLGVLRQKRAWQDRTARVFDTPEDWLKEQASCLPFSLTGAQQHALHDVRADLASGRPMNRLLQGDVGSGKTVIAALAIAMIARPSGHSPGAQSAMMAPTSILAEQHYRNLLKMLADVGDDRRVGLDDQHANTDGHTGTDTHTSAPLRPDEIRLMIGATPEGEKNEIRAGLASGAVKVIVGTHALIEDPVTFADLQLAIVDEQHRFGVEQRAALRAKGQNPHLLVMTATPIPRSLALTVYGDLGSSFHVSVSGRMSKSAARPRKVIRPLSFIHWWRKAKTATATTARPAAQPWKSTPDCKKRSSHNSSLACFTGG
jgi:ATP-dependent DNA helicase RecG